MRTGGESEAQRKCKGKTEAKCQCTRSQLAADLLASAALRDNACSSVIR